jgi:hypothetical protein
MKKLFMICLCAIVLAVLVAPVYPTFGKVRKSTDKNAIRIISAVNMFPGSVYDNAFQVPGARGKVNMVQPKGKYAVIIKTIVKRLAPDSLYKVYFDNNGVVKGDVSTAGSWSLEGEFMTDEDGNGVWKCKIPAGKLAAGNYTKSIFINRADVSKTVLISGNIEIVITD